MSNKISNIRTIDKLKAIINIIIENVNNTDYYPYNSNFYNINPYKASPVGLTNIVSIFNVTPEEGYKRYKPPQPNNGHNGLKCLIYGILFKNGKYANDIIITNIIEILYFSNVIEPKYDNTPNAQKNQQNKSNFKYGNINTQEYTGKRHILDILNTIMCLIDDSFNYGYSYMGVQYGKKGSSFTVDVDIPDPNIDTLGYLIYIVAFYNIRWLNPDEIKDYKKQFAEALQKCDKPNANQIRCKDPYLQKPINNIDKILDVQPIDSSEYYPDI